MLFLGEMVAIKRGGWTADRGVNRPKKPATAIFLLTGGGVGGTFLQILQRVISVFTRQSV
jgi:hypothetical protein